MSSRCAVSCLAVLISVFAAPVIADPQVDQPHIEITQEVTRQVPADGLRFRAVVSGRGDSASQAREDVDRNINEALSVLSDFDLGDDAVEIYSLTINEVIDWNSVEDKTLGYEATRDIEITLRDLDIAGQVADALLTAPIAAFENVRPFSDDIDAVKKEMVDEAYANCRERAERLARMSGRELGDVYWISSDPDRYPRLERVQVTGSRFVRAGETKTFPAFNIKDFEVEVAVRVVFLLD